MKNFRQSSKVFVEIFMIPKIKSVVPQKNFILDVLFNDGTSVHYDLNEDIDKLPNYKDLKEIDGLYQNVKLDESRTCIYWNDYIDLPSDILYEYGKKQKS